MGGTRVPWGWAELRRQALENEHRIRHFLTQSHGAQAAWGAEALCPLQGAAERPRRVRLTPNGLEKADL